MPYAIGMPQTDVIDLRYSYSYNCRAIVGYLDVELQDQPDIVGLDKCFCRGPN